MSNKIQVAIVEDDAHIRSLISEYLNAQVDMTCSMQCHSVEHFFESYAPGCTVHVLIQDIGLPGLSGLEAIRKVKEILPDTEILMYSVFDDAERVFKAFCAGASGYLLKNTRLDHIRVAILDLHDGKAAMSPAIAKKVISYFAPQPSNQKLTSKEQQVVQLLTDGLSYKMIADRMQISMHTVQSHIKNIYRKLQVHSK
ncbi:MAG: DNA-binding response regulator, partial [Bacteroidetes bacterium]